jgi:hypothetical protein
MFKQFESNFAPWKIMLTSADRDVLDRELPKLLALYALPPMKPAIVRPDQKIDFARVEVLIWPNPHRAIPLK